MYMHIEEIILKLVSSTSITLKTKKKERKLHFYPYHGDFFFLFPHLMTKGKKGCLVRGFSKQTLVFSHLDWDIFFPKRIVEDQWIYHAFQVIEILKEKKWPHHIDFAFWFSTILGFLVWTIQHKTLESAW